VLFRASERNYTLNAKKSVSQKAGKRNASPKKAVKNTARRPAATLPTWKQELLTDVKVKVLADAGATRIMKFLEEYFRERLVHFLRGYGSLLVRRSDDCQITPEQGEAVTILEEVLIPLVAEVNSRKDKTGVDTIFMEHWEKSLRRVVERTRAHGVTEGPQG
jgi:hypothetical protein